jgi:hypothetical protein
MFWLVASVAVLARMLRLRPGVIVGMVALWLLLLWIQTAEKTGPQIAVALTVGALVGLMIYAERRVKAASRKKGQAA